jgi:hemerythrin-like domain-containing protein
MRQQSQLLEEQHIFPIVRKAGGEAAGLVDTLLAQHARGREITDYILDKTKTGRVGTADAEPMGRALTAFSRMYEPHAAREDTIVFPALKKAIGRRVIKSWANNSRISSTGSSVVTALI